jgi:general secretion pathway protein K
MMRRLTISSTGRQGGVAIITALVIVAAATVAVSAMLWRESIAVRKVENQAALGQARWLARSAIEWARLVLLQDARTSTVDHLGEIWAVPLAETRVTDDLAAIQPGAAAPPDSSQTPFADNDAAFVSGRMRDAQARMNLRGIAIGDKVDEPRFNALVRLLDVLGLDQDLAKSIARRMGGPQQVDDFDGLAQALRQDGGVDASVIDRLRPFVTVLPATTPVNANTAPAEVLAAVFPDLPLDAARALVRSREQAWFNQVGDVASRMPGTSGDSAPPQNVSVATNWFEVQGRVRVGRADLQIAALIEREQNGLTRVRSLTEQ